jgi:hypothetical protein
MDKKIKKWKIKKWIKALRSGKWKQSRGAFRGTKGGYCCLAVADEVLGIGARPGTMGGRELDVCRHLCILEYRAKLIRLNDLSHRSFSYIADWIEKNILGTSLK